MTDGILLIDAKVHFHLAGRAPLALAQNRSVQPELDHFVLAHETLGNARGGRPEDVVVHLAADVAVVGGDEVLLIHPPADFNDQLPASSSVGYGARLHSTSPARLPYFEHASLLFRC
jgi:hypothetical protein